MRKFSYIFALLLLLAASCKDPPPEPETVDFSRGILVLNEGNFTWGNASMDFIDADGEMHRDVFRGANDIPLGDVAQSFAEGNGGIYVVVNNSGKILRLNPSNLLLETEMTGLTSPRHLALVSASKAYATDLYADALSIVNPSTGQVTGQIPVGAWTEELLTLGGKVYVTEMGSDKLLVLDPTTDTLLDSIYVGREPNSMVVDGQGKIWMMCSGGISEELPRLVRFDPLADSVETTFTFSDIDSSPGELEIDADGNTLYFLNGDVFEMEISAANLPSQALISAEGRVLYHLEVDHGSNAIYVTDAVDYVQQGNLLEYNASGNLLRSWQTGIIPGELLILP